MAPIQYISVCSGIEAATVAWHPLGWEPQLFAEISKFPSRVLAYHYPQVPNVGDFTRIESTPCDLLVGGTPCQAFSLAGLRGGMADARGNLALEFARLADRIRPRWVVWENVPGVLSSNGGRDFGSFVGALAALGYGWAYRVLDAQFFGVPQRRRRVFVVGYLGDWRSAAQVLFEPQGVRGNSAPSRQTPPNASARAAVSVGGSIAHTLRAEGFDASEDGTGRGTPIVFHATQTPISGSVSPALGATSQIGACLTTRPGQRRREDDTYILEPRTVRRLTPRECERLQGFPDDYTNIPGASDAARYHAIGNSMAVPVMSWIGSRIDEITKRRTP